MDSIPQEPWQTRQELPSRRLEAAAAANGTRLVVLGGFATGPAEVPPQEITRELLQYDAFENEWMPLEVQAPAAWSHAGLVGIGGSLYLLGGLEGSTFTANASAYRLRQGMTEWEPLCPMLEARGASAIIATPGHIFLFGGEADGVALSTVLDYVIAENRWQSLPALPKPRSHAAVMREEDGTFIVTGGSGPDGILGETFALAQNATEWTTRAVMPTARAGCAYGVMYGQLVCAGGELPNGTASRAVEMYDPTEDKWTALPDMPEERAGAAGAVVTSRLYVVGGATSAARVPTTTVYEFDLLDTIEQ